MGAPACARLLVPWTSCPNLNPSGWDDISVWDLLRTKLRRKKKWKTSKDWTKMVAGYAWKTFSSLSGSLSFGAGFVWKLCVPTKSDWNTTKALLDVFLFFCIFLFCQFICHPSPIKESIRLKHFVLLADKGISVWAIQWHSYLLCAPLNSHSKPNNHFLFKSKNADLQVNGVFILRFDLHTYGRVHASDRNESRYNIIGKKGWLPSKKFT